MWFFAARIHVTLDWVVLWNCHNIVPLLSSLYYSTAETPAGNCYNIAPRWVIEPSRWLLLEHGMLFRRLFLLRQTWNWVTFCDPVTLWPSDPGIQRPVDPVTLFYRPNELQMSTCVKYSQAKEFLIIIGKSKSSLHGRTSRDFSPTTDTWQWLLSFHHFKCTFCILGIFFENRKNSGFTLGQNDDPVTRTWKMTQMTQWPSSISVLYRRCCSSAATSRRHWFSHRTLHHSVQLCDRL